MRKEQRGGERAIGIRQRDQHEPAARPDVQRMRIERELAVARPERELLVAVIEQLLVGGDGAVRGECTPHFGSRAVGCKHDVGIEPAASAVRFDERCSVALDANALLAEAVVNAVTLRSELVEQRVQRCARYGVDLLGGPLAVGQEPLLAGKVVHPAAAHGDQKLRDVRLDAGAPQCRDAARGEREVDRPAAARLPSGRIADRAR